MSGPDDTARSSGAGAPRPSWLRAPCPPWCTREHAEEDHPEDRYHQSEPSAVPAVAAVADTVPVTASLRALTLGVRAGQYAHDSTVWIAIEPFEGREPHVVLTAASARRLAHALREQLARLDPDGA